MSKPSSVAARGMNLCVLAIVLPLVSACTRTNVVLTTETTPICTTAQLTEWDRVVSQTQGVNGHDPVGHYIASFPAEKFGVLNINNWIPMSGYKETLCGNLHHFNVYDGSGAEMDWNQFIIPAPSFEFLITDVLPYKGGSGTFCVDDDWHDCAGQDDCLEGELTPDESFYENPWFPKSTGESVLEGREICVYGPWIRECVHGHRPEIHTAELTWWKETFKGSDLYWLMALQDDSNRFDDEDEFDIEGPKPPEWRPWAAAPMSATFQLAFEVDPAGPVHSFEIGESFARNVATSGDAQARLDSDNGTQHAIQYNGKVVVRANENQPNDNDLGVTFTDICRKTDGKLRGYVTMRTRTGVNNSGQEGYHILFVLVNKQAQTPPGAVTPPDLKSKAVLVSRADPASIRPATVAGRPQLQGDFRLEVRGVGERGSQDFSISKVEVVTSGVRRELPFKPADGDAVAVVTGIPLHEQSQFAVTLTTGARLEALWPGVTVTALMNEQIAAYSEAPRSAWRNMVAVSGGAPVEPPPSLKIRHADQVELSALSQYAMVKDGRMALEEGSPMVERLNEVLAKDDAALEKTFGRSRPITLEWSVTATNLTNKAPVQVARGVQAAPEAAAVHVVERPGRMLNDLLQITLPKVSNAIYEVDVKAVVTDAFGSKREVRHQVWSHYLGDLVHTDVTSTVLPAVAAAAGVSADDLLSVARLGVLPPTDPRLRDAKVRRAMTLHNAALQAAADDGRVTVSELSALIRAAKQLSAK